MKELLQKTIENYDHTFSPKWNEFPEDYKEKMTRGIVGFKLIVNDLQAKKKLSQNRTETEKTNIIKSLSEGDDSNEKLIAEYMENEKKQNGR